MDRSEWRARRRRLNEERMDTLFAPDYDEHWGSICPTHEQMLGRFLDRCARGGRVLDATCGTGKYCRLVLGMDQSAGMLAQAETKHPRVPTVKLGMQEIGFEGVFCVDAMENVFPEDWPGLLRNFRRASGKGGPLYLTVELISPEELAEALLEGRRMGLPVVEGEYAHEGGYHYYPPVERARTWIEGPGFCVVGEETGDGYHHFLAVAG